MSGSQANRAGRIFYLTLLALSLLGIYSMLTKHGGEYSTQEMTLVRRRDASNQSNLFKKDLECRLVHAPNVKDKCAFIEANCPDEEAGLLSYLRLYYCSLPHAQGFAFVILVVWLALLFSTIGIAASDFLCINLSTIASLLGMSESLTGVTFLAFGNGSPDVFSTFAAMSSNSGSLAVGELVGAAGFITAVVAGSMALVRPFQVARKSFVRDVGFFVVAASFSMLFLADGSLKLWECAAMIGFYMFYVIFVVTWHWYLGKRRKRWLSETAARSHFHVPGHQDLDLPQAEADEETPVASERTSLLEPSAEDFAALESGTTPAWKIEDVDEDDETRDRYLAELSNNMRVSRPAQGERRNTMVPIRPSLVGALEFRSVLSSLERSRNVQTIPLNYRRYSDDPSYGSLTHQGIYSNPELLTADEAHDVGGQRPSDTVSRARAVSANDVAGLRLDTSVLEHPIESQVNPFEPGDPHSPQLAISPPASASGSRQRSPAPSPRGQSPTHLAVPLADAFNTVNRTNNEPVPSDASLLSPRSRSPSALSQSSRPKSGLQIPQASVSPHFTDRSPLTSPFPLYTDEPIERRSRPPSIHLPPPSISPASVPDSMFAHGDQRPGSPSHPLKWWPYKVLPPPQTLLSTLFPTVYGWRGKTIFDKLLGLITVPSIFLLTITLPVVEPPRDNNAMDSDPTLLTPGEHSRSRSATGVRLPEDSPNMLGQQSSSAAASDPRKNASRQNTQSIHDEEVDTDTGQASTSSPKSWNRWLVITQLFTAPFFITLILWANLNYNNPHAGRQLLHMSLISLLISLVLLLLLLFFTTPEQPPKYRPLLCFLGFAVSIAWISTIANEVVGVLKTLGVILGISDAILGLTIFAVGNSLGDLVADVTVARLGFPVMALSACFGGPMLNILLGIGIGGLYMTLRGADRWHARHPDRPVKYKPYEIEVSSTLLISGVTLLVTLVGLLVVVPWNRWRMDRKIGWGLIALWAISTTVNVIVEVTGVAGDITAAMRLSGVMGSISR
ncbi:MAG: hypothetical protein Q9227_006021 [Pyrenula ochraceoflavens]